MLRELLDKVKLNAVGAYKSFQEQVWDRHKYLTNIPEGNKVQTIIITGGNRGIGLEAVKILLSKNYKVVIGCRNPPSCVETLEKWMASLEIDSSYREIDFNFRVYHLDLMDLNSISEFARKVIEDPSLHCNIVALINNAGIMFGDRKTTADGRFESQFMTNYLGHFYLTHFLMDSLRGGNNKSAPCRIVNVSSVAHWVGSNIDVEDLQGETFYSPEGAYGNSKAAQIMFTQYLQSQLDSTEDNNIKVFAIHPGVILSDLYTNVLWVRLFRFVAWVIMKTVKQGGETLVHAALSPELNETSGGLYLENSTVSSPASFTLDFNLQRRLWDKSLQLLDLEKF